MLKHLKHSSVEINKKEIKSLIQEKKGYFSNSLNLLINKGTKTINCGEKLKKLIIILLLINLLMIYNYSILFAVFLVDLLYI